jgi:hypothetical protein
MFKDQLRRAIEVSPRADLHKVSVLLWRAHATGSIADDDAQTLAELIEARKALPPSEKPVPRRVGSRPRSPASMERRRSWVASGHLPPALACRFTPGEVATLAVIAVEVRKHGRCTLHLNAIAALAGVCRTTAKNALREAAGLSFIRVTVRRLTAWRCDSNVVVILDAAWSAWLAMGRRGVQAKPCLARIQGRKEGAADRPQRAIDGGRSDVHWTRKPRPGLGIRAGEVVSQPRV